MNHSNSDRFTTTNWSLVLAAMETAPTRATDAMERLCSRYWFPVYAAIRRAGNDAHHADDLTQGFFEFAIESRLLQRARQDKGRFRNFILTSLNNFLHNHHDRATAVKRGGGYQIVPFDEADAETILASEPALNGTPQGSFDRRWALTLIRRVMENLQADYAKRGRSAAHDSLLPHLTNNPSAADCQRLAADLDMEVATLRVALHRFRRRFGELLRSEVAHTVATPDEVEEEIRYLLSILADG
jgi:DNA-directed RNA polymerase specialized sigma24 family protein